METFSALFSWWFETLSRPSWRHCNVNILANIVWLDCPSNIHVVNTIRTCLLKGLRMVARSLWRSEARRIVPFTAWNIEWKIRQNKTSIEAYIPCINLINIMHSPQPLSKLAMTSHPSQLYDVTITTQRTLLEAHVNGTEIFLKSRDLRPNMTRI